MLSLVEMNKVTVPLGPNITAIQNMVFVQDFLANLLKAAFPHLNEYVNIMNLRSIYVVLNKYLKLDDLEKPMSTRLSYQFGQSTFCNL